MNALVRTLAIAGTLSVIGAVAAQSSSESFSIPTQGITAGSQSASSESYDLVTTAGNPESGQEMSSATFTLRGGISSDPDTTARPELVFTNGFES